MNANSLAFAAMLLASAGLASAQDPNNAPQPAAKFAAPSGAMPEVVPGALGAAFVPGPGDMAPASRTVFTDGQNCADGEHLWVSGEYLLWWIKSPRTPPLSATGPVTEPIPGAIGQPGTQILYGGTMDSQPREGARLSAGYWFGNDHTLGIDASSFWLAQRSLHAFFGSNGFPIITPPYYDVLGQKENAGPALASPGLDSGTVDASLSTRLWGYEANLRTELMNRSGFRIDGLAGFRYADLSETFEFDGTTTFAPGVPMFGGVETIGTNTYATRNFFYGGQIGGVASLERGPLSLSLTEKVALGATQEITTIAGTTTMISPTGLSRFSPVGQYAQPTNIGRYSRSRFSFLPETTFTVGYQLTQCLRATVGYDFLLWSEVLRAGDQVDRALNTSQLPPPLGAGMLTGAARPAYLGKETDFWAQGVTLGLEFKY